MMFCIFSASVSSAKDERAEYVANKLKQLPLCSSDRVYRVYGPSVGRQFSRAVLTWAIEQDNRLLRHTKLDLEGRRAYRYNIYLYPVDNTVTNSLPWVTTGIVNGQVQTLLHMSVSSVRDLSTLL